MHSYNPSSFDLSLIDWIFSILSFFFEVLSQGSTDAYCLYNVFRSPIKSFKTLGYEGSKSHVTKFQEASLLDFETGNTINLDSINNSHINNIEAEVGWYVESIFTDKQDGFIDEFDMVTNLSCPECRAFVIVYRAKDEWLYLILKQH